MTVEDVNSKIDDTRRIIDIIRGPGFIISSKEVVNILKDYIYLLEHMEVSERIINYKVYKEDET